ncbi:DNA-binding transcriptional regulator, MerR family [Bacteroidales bacterium 6E]|nr:DNA-binding transcriptional regulator, MerR family [Bacteroidales bacterium 6E]
MTNRYSIKDLEILSGVKAHTIRIWEKRYNLLSPERTDTNIRYYNDNDLRKIINVSFLVRHQFKISRISTWDSARIQTEVLNISNNSGEKDELTEQLLSCLISFENHKFLKLVNDIIHDLGIEEAYTKVFFGFLEKVGLYWQAGVLYPAQEHFVSNVLRQKLLAEIEFAEAESKNQPNMLFFLHENEMHELGLLFYSWIARKSGFNVIYLGTQVPFDDLRKVAGATRFSAVMTAFTNPMEEGFIQEYLQKLLHLFPTQKIYISGYQVKDIMDELPERVEPIRNYLALKQKLKE